MITNKYASLRGTIARAKRNDCQKVVIRVTLVEELLLQLSNAEKRITELATENAGLKTEHELALQYMDELRANFTMYKKFKCQSDVTTTATDAFLAEVRAQGVEMAAQSEQFSTWVQQGLRSFAIGVRQGAAQ